MHIAVLCAARRGYLFIRKLTELAPQNELTVFSFREETWEPPFFDDIRNLTLAHGGQFFEAKHVGSERWNQFWESRSVDLMFLVNWRYMLPPVVYLRPRLGTFVFHDSLLPEYRGFSPTLWAILNGEDHTGVTIFKIAEGLDEGDIIAQERVPIGPDESIADVMKRVTQAYLDLLEQNLDNLVKGIAPHYHQDHSRATYTCKWLPEDSQIDWTASTDSIYNLIRATSTPYPGAYTYLAGQRMRIWSAQKIADSRCYIGRIPGRIAEVRNRHGSLVLTGDGVLLLTEVQIEGGDVVCATDVLNRVSQTLGH